jgi:hypothetical protein
VNPLRFIVVVLAVLLASPRADAVIPGELASRIRADIRATDPPLWPVAAARILSTVPPWYRSGAVRVILQPIADRDIFALPGVIGSIATTHPDLAAVSAAIGSRMAPVESPKLASVAAQAVPEQAAEIAARCAFAAPAWAVAISESVSAVLPEAREEISRAVARAVPELQESLRSR